MALRRHLARGIGSPSRQWAQPSPRLFRCPPLQHQSRRPLLTLAIESSCDDTCVAILEKSPSTGAAVLHFNEKVSLDIRPYRGVFPIAAVIQHTSELGPLVRRALRFLPKVEVSEKDHGGSSNKVAWVDGHPRSKPDFVTVTRGPGMSSNLATGLNTAKGLAVAWDVPLLGVNHMQAHALTPRLVTALEHGRDMHTEKEQGEVPKETEAMAQPYPDFPFLSLLVSGGHSMLVHSHSLSNHEILASTPNIALGDMIDKCARNILLPESCDVSNAAYGPQLEEFAFPGSTTSGSAGSNVYDYDYRPPGVKPPRVYESQFGWSLSVPLRGTVKPMMDTYEFAGLNGQVQKILTERTYMGIDERRVLARETMRIAFEHLASRLLHALRKEKKGEANAATPEESTTEPTAVSVDAGELEEPATSTAAGNTETIKTVVLSGGVASNKYLRHIVRAMLDRAGFQHVQLVAPPVSLCTDNAAMIAWTGIEMYEEGWRTDLNALVMRPWPIDHASSGGGILGAPGWYRVDADPSIPSSSSGNRVRK